MDMKRILQAMDGIATKPVEGADSMAKFLRVVNEAEINQPAVKPVKVPAIPQLPAQDGDQGDGSRLTTNPDGTKTYAGAFGIFTYDAQGKAIKYTTPQFSGASQTIDLTNNQTTQNYNAGPMNTTQTVDANGKTVSHNAEYDLGVGKFAAGQDANGIRSKEYTPADGEQNMASKDMYALGNKDKESTYNRAMAQVNSAPVQENSLSKFLSIVDKNNVSMLKEGANPHKVTLPVQMAMQHYAKPTEIKATKPSLLKSYLSEVHEEVAEETAHKRQLMNQYAQTIAERVLMRESKLDEKSKSEKQARFMAAAAHDPQFAARTGIKQSVAKEFNKADTGTKQLSQAMKKKKKVNEAPIDMTGDPNDPTVYGHQQANPMSLKGRIVQARNQLKELAELAESDDLVIWEKITRLSKGGMFMGLEQNLEQIRHGINELAAKRKQGGVASRGIDKNIGEDNDPCWDSHKMVGTKKKGGKTVPNCVPKE